MSSSRIFKKDPLFTPRSLVQSNTGTLGSKENAPANRFTPSRAPEPLAQPKARSAPPQQALPIEQTPPIDIEAIKKDAYSQGMKAQAAQYQAEVQQTIAAFAEACQKIDNQRKVLLEQNRADIINLIITLSKKILGQELVTPRNSIAATLQGAIEQAIECEEYHITLNPDDLAFAEEKAPELIASIRGLERIVCKADRNIARGGCLLESTACFVDATLETQMENMKEFLEEQADILQIPEAE